MSVELRVPEVGESISEVQIGQWLKQEGDFVQKDENVVELETEKATVELPAPTSGRIAKLVKRYGDTAHVGEVIAYLEEVAGTAASAPSPVAAGNLRASTPTDADRAAAAAQQQAAQSIKTSTRAKDVTMPPRPVSSPARRGAPPPAESDAGRPDQSLVVSTDVPRPVEALQKTPTVSTAESVIRSAAGPYGPREEEAVPMSPIRRRIAQRLVEAQQTMALLTTFNEVDMSSVASLRSEHREVFQQKYGVKLGFMSFFVKAAVDALKLVPQVNAQIRGTDIVYHNYFDIGIAIGGGKGLVVPVLRDADRLSFAEIELAIADLARRARDNALTVDELQGGTFTITNGGVYGSMLSTPIVNPPQSGILGLHAIGDRPVARNGQVVIRPMMYIALTYDHRIVDGEGAVTFLKRIKEVIEQPLRMLVEV